MQNPVRRYLQDIYDSCSRDRSGAMADYIPDLAEGDPELFGVCVATVDGYVYEVGDTGSPFLMQSISKPFTYALALSDHGIEQVGHKIDVEPSGDAFNEISLSPRTERPRNAMINAGAITAASLIGGESAEERFERVRTNYSKYAGRDLVLDEDAYASERATGHRNRAIGHMLREFDVLEMDPNTAVDQYLKQCSLLVDCQDLSLMAATLANGGIQPRTGERVLSAPLVEHVLSVMTTCGMYDGAGDWVSTVGMPAKSGVSGGIIAVLPGQVGIAVYSPRLDGHGNSIRGAEACRRLSEDLEMHFLHVGRGAHSAIRASYDLLESPSRRRRSEPEMDVLAKVGDRAQVYELHGDLLFAGAESVVRAVTERGDDTELVVLDVRRVDEVARVAKTMLVELHDSLLADGHDGVLVDPEGILPRAGDGPPAALRSFRTRNAAVEWCEDRLIERYGDPDCQTARVEVADHPLVTEIGAEAMRVIEPLLVRRRFADAEAIVAAGSPAVGIYLILSGRVVSSARGPDGETLRLAMLSAGMSFGELAIATGGQHVADVTADGPVEAMVLPAESVSRLQVEHPEIALVLWQAMAQDAYRLMDRAMREAAARASYGA